MSHKAYYIHPTEYNSVELSKLLQNLDINMPIHIYKYNQIIYIQITRALFDFLNIAFDKFKKKVNIIEHYIILQRKIYLNKYGWTKLFAQIDNCSNSKDQTNNILIDRIIPNNCIFTLQDHILELIRNIELQQYHEQQINKHDINMKNLAQLSDQYNTLYKNYNMLFAITKKLSKQIKNIIDITGEDHKIQNLLDQFEMFEKKKDHIKVDPKKLYYLMQITYPITNINGLKLYKWRIDSTLPYKNQPITIYKRQYDSFKDFSQIHRLEYIQQYEYLYVWYQDIYLDLRSVNILNVLFRLLNYIEESTAIEIIQLFKD